MKPCNLHNSNCDTRHKSTEIQEQMITGTEYKDNVKALTSKLLLYF